MVPSEEELSPAIGMVDEADGMPMVRMRVPVQTPASADVAVVRPPVDADAGENRHQDSCIEDAGVEPIPRAARVQPLPRKQTRKKGHRSTARSITCPSHQGQDGIQRGGGKGAEHGQNT